METKQTYRIAAAVLVLAACPVAADATAAIGSTATQKLRTPLPDGVIGFQAQPHFLLMIGNPSDAQRSESANPPLVKVVPKDAQPKGGYDLSESITTFAPAVGGVPSQSGWHEHPTPIGFVQVLQGTLYEQDASNPGCLTVHPAGSAFVEHRGDVHNVFNFDPNVPAVIRSAFFFDRAETVTRTDRPDPITGDPNVASPPPTTLCAQ
jgi:hypothetical protein